MTKSRLFLYSCLAFWAGVAGANWLRADLKICGLIIFLLFLILFFLAKTKDLKAFTLIWIVGFLGLAYADFLGQNNLFGGGFLNILARLLTQCRIYVENLNLQMMAEPYASLMNGILLGTKNGLGYELTKVFKSTGLTHIVAISGYNVTIIVNAFYLMAEGIPYRLRMGLTFGLIFLFVILTGGSASVVRAGIMSAMIIAARLFGRKALALNSLIFAATLMIVEKPSILVENIGFQLSVAATLGLVLINPILNKRVGDRGVIKRLPENLRDALFTTLAAQAMTVPIILYYFKNVSLVSPIANLIILPIIPLTMIMGFMGIGLGLIYFPLGYFISLGTWVVLFILVWLVEKMATIPYSSVILPGWTTVLILPYYGILFYLIYKHGREIKSEPL